MTVKKATTKVINPTLYNRGKQRAEPIRIPSNYLYLAQKAGIMDEFWFLIGWKTFASFKPITKRRNRQLSKFTKKTI